MNNDDSFVQKSQFHKKMSCVQLNQYLMDFNGVLSDEELIHNALSFIQYAKAFPEHEVSCLNRACFILDKMVRFEFLSTKTKSILSEAYLKLCNLSFDKNTCNIFLSKIEKIQKSIKEDLKDMKHKNTLQKGLGDELFPSYSFMPSFNDFPFGSQFFEQKHDQYSQEQLDVTPLKAQQSSLPLSMKDASIVQRTKKASLENKEKNKSFTMAPPSNISDRSKKPRIRSGMYFKNYFPKRAKLRASYS